MSAKAKKATLHVRQIKSGIGFSGQQNATLKALGLGKVGRSRDLPDNPAVRGMLAKIPHLLSVEAERDKA